MLNVIILSVSFFAKQRAVMLNVVILSIVMLSVVMMSVALFCCDEC